MYSSYLAWYHLYSSSYLWRNLSAIWKHIFVSYYYFICSKVWNYCAVTNFENYTLFKFYWHITNQQCVYVSLLADWPNIAVDFFSFFISTKQILIIFLAVPFSGFCLLGKEISRSKKKLVRKKCLVQKRKCLSFFLDLTLFSHFLALLVRKDRNNELSLFSCPVFKKKKYFFILLFVPELGVHSVSDVAQ